MGRGLCVTTTRSQVSSLPMMYVNVSNVNKVSIIGRYLPTICNKISTCHHVIHPVSGGWKHWWLVHWWKRVEGRGRWLRNLGYVHK